MVGLPCARQRKRKFPPAAPVPSHILQASAWRLPGPGPTSCVRSAPFTGLNGGPQRHMCTPEPANVTYMAKGVTKLKTVRGGACPG